MTERLEAIAIRKYQINGEEKTSYTQIGSAFTNKSGWTVRLHCIPAAVDGEYTILLMAPKPRDGEAPKKVGSSAPAFGDEDRDSIPF